MTLKFKVHEQVWLKSRKRLDCFSGKIRFSWKKNENQEKKRKKQKRQRKKSRKSSIAKTRIHTGLTAICVSCH